MSWFLTLDADTQRNVLALAVGNEAAAEYAGPGAPPGFVAYLAAADRLCRTKHGMSIFDLADYCWRDAYDDEEEPAEALTAAINAEF